MHRNEPQSAVSFPLSLNPTSLQSCKFIKQSQSDSHMKNSFTAAEPETDEWWTICTVAV